MAGSISPRMSFKGWDFLTWLKRNKDTIKLLITAIGGLIAAQSTSGVMQLLFGSGGALITKLVLDSIDFYTTEVKL